MVSKKIIELELSASEKSAFDNSVAAVKGLAQVIDKLC